MSINISENTQAILLLTAPLLLKSRNAVQYELLKPKEYHQLVSYLKEIKKQPSDLLSDQRDEILDNYSNLNKVRIYQLLDRGFLLSQAVENWHSRGIWVISRADETYPSRLKMRLKEQSPIILYGAGDVNLLGYGGLSIVGSRNIDEELITYTKNVARLSAQSQRMVVSGGAKGVDSAAMYGALQSNGCVCGVLAEGLEKAVLNVDNRLSLQNNQLVLISACDPKTGFHVANAMQRNKYIYALSDAALVVNSDFNKGGTWSGAVEQLDKYKQIPIYIRSTGNKSDGLEALKNKGAIPWTNPNEVQDFLKIFNQNNLLNITQSKKESSQLTLFEEPSTKSELNIAENTNSLENNDNKIQEVVSVSNLKPNDLLFTYVTQLVQSLTLNSSKKDNEIANALGVSSAQMKSWLKRLVDEQLLIKEIRPVKYRWKD